MSWTPFLPSLFSILLYWIFFIPDTQPGWEAVVIKCLPTITCALAIQLQNISSNRHRDVKLGLIFSTVGDAALVWSEYFLLGMASFAVGHYFYIKSVRSKSLLGESPTFSIVLAVIVYGTALVIFNFFIRPGLTDPVLAVGVPLYIIWLTTTVWVSGVSKEWTMFLGAILFMISDCIIGINMFYSKVSHHQFLIMSTYQAAQLLIAVSAINSRNIKNQ